MVICILSKQNVGEQLQLHLLHTNGEKTPSVVPELPKPIKSRGLKRVMMKRIREENIKYLIFFPHQSLVGECGYHEGH